jgi:hypothetical protein
MDVADVLSEGIAVVDHGSQVAPGQGLATIRSLGSVHAVLGE